MINAFAQGVDSLRALRAAELGVPIFAHRVGAAFWARHATFGVAPPVVAELTRACGADFVQVGSFTGSVYDTPDEVRAQIDACHRQLVGAKRAVAVIGGGVGPQNAEAQLAAAGSRSGLLLLLGSAAYEHGAPKEAVRATVETVRRQASRPKNELEIA
jgi:ribulose 1,5-bisphosphate carboxylase large subunit-like protein